MLHFIEIENFRCFQKTRLEGFGRVNLIGGRNNAGKTALLEAILLNCNMPTESFNLLRTMRNEQHTEVDFTNFFYNSEKTNKIRLDTNLFENIVKFDIELGLHIRRNSNIKIISTPKNNTKNCGYRKLVYKNWF